MVVLMFVVLRCFCFFGPLRQMLAKNEKVRADFFIL
jgi:hypothetical protein